MFFRNLTLKFIQLYWTKLIPSVVQLVRTSVVSRWTFFSDLKTRFSPAFRFFSLQVSESTFCVFVNSILRLLLIWLYVFLPKVNLNFLYYNRLGLWVDSVLGRRLFFLMIQLLPMGKPMNDTQSVSTVVKGT